MFPTCCSTHGNMSQITGCLSRLKTDNLRSFSFGLTINCLDREVLFVYPNHLEMFGTRSGSSHETLNDNDLSPTPFLHL